MTVVDVASLPERILAPGFHARVMHGTSLTIMRVQIDAGSHLPRHQHPHEQATTILSGHLQLTIGETVHEMGPGTTVFIPGGAPHQAFAPVETEAIDVFTPVREDYRQGEPR